MLFPTPLFSTREFGGALEGGWKCPACRATSLVVTVAGEYPEPDELECPSCAGKFRSGWRRHVWRESAPLALRGTPAGSLGGLYETMQRYPAPPTLLLPEEGRLPHLADFVVDIDRETLPEAVDAARRVYAFLDGLAPGQVRLYFSGSKGFHVIVPWQTVGAVPGTELVQREYRFLAARVHRETGVAPDYKLYSPDRMLRLPDSWHGKTGRYKVELLTSELEDVELLSLAPRGRVNETPPSLAEDLNALYLECREEALAVAERLSSTPRLDFSGGALRGAEPPCITSLMQRGLPFKGTRHHVYATLARYWLSRGVPMEERSEYGKLTGGAIVLAREFARREDPSTSTPLALRVRDFEETVRYTYGREWRFDCSAPKEVGLCSPDCPVRSLSSHPLAHLLGIIA